MPKNMTGIRVWNHNRWQHRIGTRYGHLTVTAWAGLRTVPGDGDKLRSHFTCLCDCGQSVVRCFHRIARSDRSGTFYCSMTCPLRVTAEHERGLAKQLAWAKKDGFDDVVEYAAARALWKAKDRNSTRQRLFGLTRTEILYLWKKQEGRCAITGVKFSLTGGPRRIDQASLDRIDSSKDYVTGNVWIVCLGVNFLKNSFALEDVIRFFSVGIWNLTEEQVEQNLTECQRVRQLN